MMIERILIRPINNLIVRDPVTFLPLPAEGKHVPLNTYWARRLKDCSVERIGVLRPRTEKESSSTVKNKKGNK